LSRDKILLVEDDTTLRFLGTKHFLALGLPLDLAANGAEAVKMAEAGYALILMDLSMPIMDGIEATSHIREHELRNGLKRTPIVGLTAFSEQEVAAKVAGMDEFLLKPVPFKTLAITVAKYLNLRTIDKSGVADDQRSDTT
jgi:CheY-like chemotaxis protein